MALSFKDMGTKSKAIINLWALLRTKYYQIFQIAKAQWLKEGGYITLFYASIKCKIRRNFILALQVAEV